MTDKDKILAVCDALDVSVVERGRSSLQIARRRLYFNEAGELDKIIDYPLKLVAHPDRVAGLPYQGKEHDE